MGNRCVVYFHSNHPWDLNQMINLWLEEHDYTPISISTLLDGKEFVAHLIVEEKVETFDSLWTDGGLPI